MTAALLDGLPAARARDAVRAVTTAIAASLDQPFAVLASVSDPGERAALQRGLSSGWAGVSLLFGALDQAEPDGGHGVIAAALLERAIAAAAEPGLDASLHGGVCGIGFAIELVAGDDPDDPNREVDAMLAELLAAPWPGLADVIDGLAGIAVYLLARRQAGRPGAADLLEQVVRGLEAAARPQDVGVAWPGPDGLRELGLAHGTAGVVAILAGLARAGVAPARVAPLLDGGVAWLRAQERDHGPARFPGAIARSGRIKPARHGWCSGDLGVASALLAAARVTDDRALAAHAIEIAVAAAAVEPARVASHDGCLCHGAAGAGHLLHRLFRATGDPRLAEGARRWFARTLDLRCDDDRAGIGGVRTREGDGDDATWIAHPGFLVGAAGTALALLAAIEPWQAPRWDHALVLGEL